MTRHMRRFTSAEMVGCIIMMLGKGTVMGVSGFATFILVRVYEPDVQQPAFPAAVVMIVAYLVASMFLSVFSFSGTAILHCFILD